MLHNITEVGIGKTLRVHSIQSLKNDKIWRNPLESELHTGSDLINEVRNLELKVFKLLVVGSLPKKYSSLLGPSLFYRSEEKPISIMEMGNHCGSILDAIYYSFCSVLPSDQLLLLCIDSFRSSYNASSSGENWGDGGGSIFFSPNGKIQVTLMSFTTISDISYLEQIHRYGMEIETPFSPNHITGFSEIDRRNQFSLLRAALYIGDSLDEHIAGIVLINRSKNNLQFVRSICPVQIPIYASRGEFGHRGGADLIHNFKSALKSTDHKLNKIIFLANGLGHTWSCMVLKIKHEKQKK